ncbi:MAG: response regulator transcription factor [Bryobacter sp.]|nr:response regulator transcription factor [Bryobacter sp. CoA8 C33]
MYESNVNVTETNYPPQTRTASVLLCESQPLTVEGVRAVLGSTSDLQVTGVCENLALCREISRRQRPDVVLIDKALGVQAVMDWIQDLRLADQDLERLMLATGRPGDMGAAAMNPTRPMPRAVVWGVSMTEAEALRFLQAGAKGILRKSTSPSNMLNCIRTVVNGKNWMEDSVFREQPREDRHPRSELTAREQQVMELVEQGLKNREIARELGIRPGTVKIHLKHIFEKTGVRGRYGLALTGLRQKGVLNVDRHVDRESEQPAERRLERKLDGQLDRQLESLLAR